MKGKKRASAKNNTVCQNIINTPAESPEPKEELKEEIILQFGDQELAMEAISEKVRQSFAESHGELKLKEVKIYVKPQDHKAYYVANGEIEGSVEL